VTALDGARDMLRAAQQAHAQATADVEAQKAALERAGAAFNADPTDEAETVVERVSRDLRKAKRFLDARSTALEAARKEHAEHARLAALAERDMLLAKRADGLQQVRDGIAALVASYAGLHTVVSGIETALAADRELVARVNELARGTGVPEEFDAIEPEPLRLGVGVLLSRKYRLPDLPRGTNFAEFVGDLSWVTAPGTQEDMRRHLSRALVTFDAAVGDAELARWLTIHESPRSGDLSAGAEKLRSAERLLDALGVR